MKKKTKSTIKYILTRLIEMLIVLILLSLIVFVLSRLCPGDPLRSWYGDGVDRMSTYEKSVAREDLGLNKSIPSQYGIWVNDLIHGNLGLSYKYKRPVSNVISAFIGNTLLFGITAFVITFILAFFLGRFSAEHEGTRLDKLICKAGIVSGNIPLFFLSVICILVFSVKLHIFPTGGAYSYGASGSKIDRLWHLVLPVFVMVIGHLWYYSYMVRNLLLEEMRKDYVLILKAYGMPRVKIIKKYCMKNILPPMITVMAIAVPHLLGGMYVVEMVFGYPGIGKLSFESALYKDYNLFMTTTLLTGAIVVVCNYLAQIISECIDTRMLREDTVNEEYF